MSNVASSRRWYDDKPLLSETIKNLLSLPYSLQLVIVEGVVYLLNKECEAQHLIRALRSVGHQNVTGLHKSKNRRRQYDANPYLHKAMNYLLILSTEGQALIAEQVQELLECNLEYFKTCKEFGGDSDLKDVAELTSVYVEQGNEAALQQVNQIREEFLSGVRAQNKITMAATGSEMQVRGDAL
ncbi:MAG: hypothetical protein KTR14_03605 [Vampirovibrio sp.]|nr:hypothetical protein [Vampirovibrio sp.]